MNNIDPEKLKQAAEALVLRSGARALRRRSMKPEAFMISRWERNLLAIEKIAKNTVPFYHCPVGTVCESREADELEIVVFFERDIIMTGPSAQHWEARARDAVSGPYVVE